MDYEPLQHETSIRLLEVQRGYIDDDLVCKTIDSLADSTAGIPYSALSYTWGEYGPKKAIIYVNGHEFHATENLYLALRRIRKADRSVYLWADAICIDQNNEEEKGHQVKQMGAIYAGAEEVLIWLGESDEDMDALMDLADSAAKLRVRMPPTEEDWNVLKHHRAAKKKKRLEHVKYQKDNQKFGLKKLMNMRWFERVWVLQEVAMARTAKILCGSWVIPGQIFALMPKLLGLDIGTHARAVLDIMPRYRASSWWSSDRSLAVLLEKYADSHSTLSRDKIYALLGLSDDACDPRQFYPCYKKSDAQVVRDTASFIAFGEILDTGCLLPEFTMAELGSSVVVLVCRMLIWLLARDGAHIRRAIAILVCRLNEGRFGETETLLVIERILWPKHARKHPQMPVKISVEFRDKEHVLCLDTKWKGRYRISAHFPRPDDEPHLAPLKSPFYDNEMPSIGIQRLIDAGISKEELLRAYVWMGDKKAVTSLIEAGVDMSTEYQDGRTVQDLLSLGDRYDGGVPCWKFRQIIIS